MTANIHAQLARVIAHGAAQSPSLVESIHDGLPAHGGGSYTKAEANYRTSDDKSMSCGTCAHYTKGSNTCSVVSGQIKPNMVSDHYTPLESEGAEQVP